MTVSFPLQAMHGQLLPSSTDRMDDDSIIANGFETLLQQMLGNDGIPVAGLRSAATLSPEIGTHSHRFVSAQLLVSTAVSMAQTEASVPNFERISELPTQVEQVLQSFLKRAETCNISTPVTGAKPDMEFCPEAKSQSLAAKEPASPITANPPPARQPTDNAAETFHAPAIERIGKRVTNQMGARPLLIERPAMPSLAMEGRESPTLSLEPRTALPIVKEQRVASPAPMELRGSHPAKTLPSDSGRTVQNSWSRSSTIVTPVSPKSPQPFQLQDIQNVMDTADLPPASAARELAAPSGLEKGRLTPFKVHLQTIEGGLRLILQLPRMSESERREVITQITPLLERYSIRKREILIQDMASE